MLFPIDIFRKEFKRVFGCKSKNMKKDRNFSKGLSTMTVISREGSSNSSLNKDAGNLNQMKSVNNCAPPNGLQPKNMIPDTMDTTRV